MSRIPPGLRELLFLDTDADSACSLRNLRWKQRERSPSSTTAPRPWFEHVGVLGFSAGGAALGFAISLLFLSHSAPYAPRRSDGLVSAQPLVGSSLPAGRKDSKSLLEPVDAPGTSTRTGHRQLHFNATKPRRSPMSPLLRSPTAGRIRQLPNNAPTMEILHLFLMRRADVPPAPEGPRRKRLSDTKPDRT